MPIERDLVLIEALVDVEARRRGTLGVTRLAAVTGMDKGQVSRALKVLESEGVVDRDAETMEYRIGWRLPAMLSLTQTSKVLRLARTAMKDLAPQFPTAIISFATLRQTRVYLLHCVSPGGTFQDTPWHSKGYPAFCVAPGRVLLADLGATELKALYPSGLDPSEGPNSRVKTLHDLTRVLHGVRHDGYAISDGEWEPDLVAVAAPIHDDTGKVIAALNVSGVEAPNDEDTAARKRHLKKVGMLISSATGRISAQLGWTRFAVG